MGNGSKNRKGRGQSSLTGEVQDIEQHRIKLAAIVEKHPRDVEIPRPIIASLENVKNLGQRNSFESKNIISQCLQKDCR